MKHEANQALFFKLIPPGCRALFWAAAIGAATFGVAAAGDLGQAKFTGWMDTDLIGNDKEGNRPYIDAHHLYLIWDHKIDSRFRVYTEVEIEHSPNTGSGLGTVKLERLYSEISLQTGFNIRLGKFNTPFGYWTPTHWAILVETVLKPIHENNKYVPPKSVGIETFGRIFVGENDIEWNAFFSNGSEYEATNKPQDRRFGGGLDARLNLLEGDAFIGTSGYKQSNPSKEGRDETSYVAYGGLQVANFDLKGEYVTQSRGNGDLGTKYSDVSTYYVSGRYFVIPEFAVGARLDSGDDDKSGAGENHQVTSLFVNWMPIPRALGKVEYNIQKFDADSKDDYNSWALYFGLIF